MKSILVAMAIISASVSLATTPEASELCLEAAKTRYAAAQAETNGKFIADLDRCGVGTRASDRCYQIAGRRLERNEQADLATYQTELAACLR